MHIHAPEDSGPTINITLKLYKDCQFLITLYNSLKEVVIYTYFCCCHKSELLSDHRISVCFAFENVNIKNEIYVHA